MPDREPAQDRIILVKGRAGLGNRIVSLLSAALFARLTRRRLVVDWSDPTYSSDGSNSIHHFFTSPLFSPAGQIPDTASIHPALWRGHLRDNVVAVSRKFLSRTFRYPTSSRHTSADLSRLDHPEQVLVMWSFFPLIRDMRHHFRGPFSEFRGLDDEAILSRLMKETLHLHPSIMERVTAIRATWPARPVIGVHIRHTDRKARIGAIQSRLRQLLTANPGLGVFLCTDNRDVEASLRLAYPDLLTTSKWFPDNGHDRMHECQDCPDKRANGVEALTDLYLLAGCDHLVLDKSSSFAYLAALLSDQAPGRIHDLHPWRLLTPNQRYHLFCLSMFVRWAPRRVLERLAPGAS